MQKPTSRPGNASRYLTRLCQHAGKMGRPHRHRPRMHARGGAPPQIQQAEWSGNDGTLILDWGQCILDWGQCILHASQDTLTLQASALDGENLSRIQQLISARLEGFGRREQLTVTWHPTE